MGGQKWILEEEKWRDFLWLNTSLECVELFFPYPNRVGLLDVA